MISRRERRKLESRLPNLRRTTYEVTSLPDWRYNCLSWAVGETHRPWWPHQDGYWPSEVLYEESQKAFIQAFETLGYMTCDNDTLEKGYEKIAIFADKVGIPTHAARQLGSGSWTSKLGLDVDITHRLRAVGGHRKEGYGDVVIFMKRLTSF